MPSPIGHSLMGCLIARSNPRPYFAKPWKLALFCAVLANLPDMDYFFGIVQGLPNLYHRQFTHSIGFAVLIGVLCGLYFKARGLRFLPMFVMASVACFSHVILDFFGADTSAPHGVVALWPFSQSYFVSPLPIFSNLIKSDTIAGVIKDSFRLHNVLALLREMAIFVLLFALQNWYMKNRLALAGLFKGRAPSSPPAETEHAQGVREF